MSAERLAERKAAACPRLWKSRCSTDRAWQYYGDMKPGARAAGGMSAEKISKEGGRSLSLVLRRSSQQTASTSGVYRQSKKFPNGDTYSGGWRNGLPDGEGRYCWADGSTYEGGWRVNYLTTWLKSQGNAQYPVMLYGMGTPDGTM